VLRKGRLSRICGVSASRVQHAPEGMSDCTFTFCGNSNCKNALTEAARANDRSGSQLLRDFMRDQIERAEDDLRFEPRLSRA
jgi:hypothetical protein